VLKGLAGADVEENLYGVLAAISSTILFCGAIALAVAGARLNPQYLKCGYPKSVALALFMSLVVPLVHSWGTPISLADAYLLRSDIPGWRYVANVYSILAGFLVGGIAALFVRREPEVPDKNNSKSNDRE
jgi:hypothetical protein